MALKPDRTVGDGATLEFYVNHVIERGGIVVVEDSGSGAAMDQSLSLAIGSGLLSSGTVPLGLLLNDVVNKDLTQTHLNQHKDEVQIGGKCTVLRRGVVTTNVVVAGESPTNGNAAYYTPGTWDSVTNVFLLSTSDPSDAGAEQRAGLGETGHRVGTFLSSKDEDGYVKVSINL